MRRRGNGLQPERSATTGHTRPSNGEEFQNIRQVRRQIGSDRYSCASSLTFPLLLGCALAFRTACVVCSAHFCTARMRIGLLGPPSESPGVPMPERVAHILADYALEARELAYTSPSGLGETEAFSSS